MEKADIHHIPNWDTQDDQEWATVTQRLSWPYHRKDEKGALSGADCMIIVIQQALHSLGRQYSQHLIRQHRSHNLLVDFAIRDFARGTDSQLENMQNARDVFWGGLFVHKLGTSGTPSFLEIDQCALMQATLWGEPEMHAFHESLVKPPGADGFEPAGDLKEYPSDLAGIRTSRSLFTWDTSRHKNFDDMFEAHFNRTQVDGAHGTYTLVSKPPKIARVLLDPTMARLEGLGISDLYRMPMATRSVTSKDRDDGEDGSVLMYSAQDRVTTFSLIAVVRLRRSQHEHDYVRLYDKDGQQVVPRLPAEECTSYHNDAWSVADQDHQYMLYYAYIPDPNGFVPPPSGGQARWSSVPPEPSSQMQCFTLETRPMPAPWVRPTAREVARRRKPPRQGSTTASVFGIWAAAQWDAERKQGEQQPGRQEPHPQAQGQARPESISSLTGGKATIPSTRSGPSRHSELFSLPIRTRPSSLDTLPSSAQHGPVSMAGPTKQAGSALQGKPSQFADRLSSPTLPPIVQSQSSSRGVQEMRENDAGKGDDAPSHQPKSHKMGEDSKWSSSSKKKKRNKSDELSRGYIDNMALSSSFEEMRVKKARHDKPGD